MNKILVVGACGQLGIELTLGLRALKGKEQVVASDVREVVSAIKDGPFEQLNILDAETYRAIIEKHDIQEVYLLAAILSAKGEENTAFAWKLNMEGLLTVLESGKDRIKKIYWPSSISVFGTKTPKQDAPQDTIMNPNTVYGISKLAGERWCEYYHEKYGVDVRSLRYPGLIGYKALPGGGTTDYAVDMFYKAIGGESYACFLREDTVLPMMYMDDAIKATIDLMETAGENVKIRSSYNLAAMSFSAKEIAEEIQKTFPDFKVSFNPDFRQHIADSWPDSIDDGHARTDWGWKHAFGLKELVTTMITKLKSRSIVE